MANQCANCKLRAKYDQKPTSLIGRFLALAHQLLSGLEGVFYVVAR